MTTDLQSDLAAVVKTVGESARALSRPDKTYRTSFGLSLRALAELKLLAADEGATEKAILDGVTALCAVPKFKDFVDRFVNEASQIASDETKRRTRVVSRATCKLLDEITERLEVRRDAAMEGLIMFAAAYFRLDREWRKERLEQAKQKVEEFLWGVCEPASGEIDRLLAEAGSHEEVSGIVHYLEERVSYISDEIRRIEKSKLDDDQRHEDRLRPEIERLRQNTASPLDDELGE